MLRNLGKYVFMFSNNYDGKRNLIQNADEDVDCMTYAKDTSLYSNDSFFVFVWLCMLNIIIWFTVIYYIYGGGNP